MSFDFIDRKHGQPKPVSTPEAPKPLMWWCDHCQEELEWSEIHVVHGDETHDKRVGGCGCVIYPWCDTCENSGFVFSSYQAGIGAPYLNECEDCCNPNRRMKP